MAVENVNPDRAKKVVGRDVELRLNREQHSLLTQHPKLDIMMTRTINTDTPPNATAAADNPLAALSENTNSMEESESSLYARQLDVEGLYHLKNPIPRALYFRPFTIQFTMAKLHDSMDKIEKMNPSSDRNEPHIKSDSSCEYFQVA